MPPLPASPNTAVLIASRELQNFCRKGTPPATPPYAPPSGLLWRGETVCLRQLAVAQNVDVPNRILAGITWCEHKGSSGRIDLDLSVLLYDKHSTKLAHCDYTHLRVGKSMTHSGDWTSAPYPRGARETVEIDLEALASEFPEAAFVCFVVYSYSGQAFEDMHDSSVFVADAARSGQGPGGTAVLSAARLTGAGQQNVAAYLRVSDGHLDFVNIDATLNTRVHTASADRSPTSDTVKRTHEALTSRLWPEVRLSFAASVLGAAFCDRTIIVSAEGAGETLVLADGESRNDFLTRILAALESACRAPSSGSSCISATAVAAAAASLSSLSVDGSGDGGGGGGRLLVIGGTTEDQRGLLSALGRPDAVYCNLRAEDGGLSFSRFPGVAGRVFRASSALEAAHELAAALAKADNDDAAA